MRPPAHVKCLGAWLQHGYTSKLRWKSETGTTEMATTWSHIVANSNTPVQSLMMILFWVTNKYFQRVSKSLGPWFWGKYFPLEDFRRWESRSNSKRWDVRHNYSRGECSRSQSCTKSRMDTHCGQLINKGVAFYMSDVAFRNKNWPTFLPTVSGMDWNCFVTHLGVSARLPPTAFVFSVDAVLAS